jgi:hypothetical protein
MEIFRFNKIIKLTNILPLDKAKHSKVHRGKDNQSNIGPGPEKASQRLEESL